MAEYSTPHHERRCGRPLNHGKLKCGCAGGTAVVIEIRSTDGGNKADFQSSDLGNLHIKATNTENSRRTVAIGFLPGEQLPPINMGPIRTALDVGGVTRIRNLRDTLSNCLVTGFNVGSSGRDNFHTRLDFLEYRIPKFA